MRAQLTGASLHIDLSALQRNWKRFASLGTAAACVKADGYGLGAIPVAKALWNAGCRSFFVAFPAEGIALRAALPEAEIFVLMGLLAGQASEYRAHRLTPALAQPAELEEWVAFGARRKERLPAAIHVDTGINRLGFSENEVRAIKPEQLDGISLSLVMSHLANADVPDDAANARQLARFAALRQLLPPARASLANSPGSLLAPTYRHDLMRPGVGLYGACPFGADAKGFETVARLTAPVLQVREVAEGERVGYAGSFTAKRPSRIAILGVGYADGYPRALSAGPDGGPARVMFGRHEARLVGRVSMDMICVDVTHLPQVARASVAELLGEQIRLEELARLSGTISYEILTRLGSRHARVYSGGDSMLSRSGP